ncbi:MAG TPA: polyprenyl synthetase family protein [Anaeromyxobacteraceae bacterium]|nr:polyprenyl synthetase family protein [Anaeromyxobacteraceae bacterium]
MPGAFAIEDYLRSTAARVEVQLRRVADARRRAGPPRLAEALAHALLGGGKRLRPALALASAEAVGGDAGDDSLAMRFAVALEMVHTYSLVHDDLPCMDDDDLRRGRPTVHRAFDEATAVLVGDGLQSEAFAGLLAGGGDRAGRLALLLAEGATRMVEGQAMDVAAEGRRLEEPEVLELMARKTGALLAAAVAGGAIAGCGEVRGMDAVGRLLGLAFQIADDLLDLTGDASAMGKRAGKDAAAGKATLPGLVGVAEARRRADALCAEAVALLSPLGDRAEPLRALARFVVTRRS